MKTISLFCYVKNEERLLEKALKSIRDIAEELIVIDTGSTDNTVNIAKQIADKVVHWPWQNDFAKASNFGSSLCNGDYLGKWDGDWVLREGDADKISTYKKSNFENRGLIEFAVANEFDENLNPHMINRKPYLYKREAYTWIGQAHDYLVPKQAGKLSVWEDRFLISEPEKITSDTVFYNDVLIYHYKDKLRVDRYKQTSELIDEELKSAKQEQIPRLVFFAVSGSIFAEKYDRGMEYLQMLGTIEKAPLWAQEFYGTILFYQQRYMEAESFINSLDILTPQLELVLADILALFEPDKAIVAYTKFIAKYGFTRRHINLNFKRMIDHPQHMISLLKSSTQTK